MYALQRQDQISETFLQQPAPLPRCPDGADREDREFYLTLGPDFPLDHGVLKNPAPVRVRVCGSRSAPVLFVLGGISADCNIFNNARSGEKGWWDILAGPGKVLDPARYCLVSFDFIPHDRDTADAAVTVTPGDQARVAAAVADSLCVREIACFIGGSYGGMVALAFAALYPDRVQKLFVMNAAAAASPSGVALRSIQRQIVTLGLQTGRGDQALALARQLGMATYRTSGELNERFAGRGEANEDGFSHPVCGYLEARGQAFIGRMAARRYLSLSQSIDLHHVEPAAIRAQTTFWACRSDQLVPIEDVRVLSAGLGGRSTLHEVYSIYGHDSFLKETDSLTRVLRLCLEEKAEPVTAPV